MDGRKDCRAVIVDFDRTLLRTDKSISDYTLLVLRGLGERGIRLFAATARPERAVTAFTEQIPFDAVSTLNGARTVIGNRVIERPVRASSAQDVLERLCRERDMTVSVETESGLRANRDIPAWRPAIMDDLTALARREKIYKIIAGSPDGPAVPPIPDLPGDTYASVADGRLCQIMSRDATKWNGVCGMLASFGIDAAQAVYFGDDNDDVEPLMRCGLGVAVRNASDRVREAADRITASNDEDGVARFLAEYLRGPSQAGGGTFFYKR